MNWNEESEFLDEQELGDLVQQLEKEHTIDLETEPLHLMEKSMDGLSDLSLKDVKDKYIDDELSLKEVKMDDELSLKNVKMGDELSLNDIAKAAEKKSRSMSEPLYKDENPFWVADYCQSNLYQDQSKDNIPVPELKTFSYSETRQDPDIISQLQYECHTLRALNDGLTATNEQLKMELEKVKETQLLLDNSIKIKEHLEELQVEKDQKMTNLEERLKALSQECKFLKNNQLQISELKKTLEEEKEFEILSIKKEILLQKEKQLQEMRNEFLQEKQDFAKKSKDQIMHVSNTLDEEREQHEKELSRYKKMLSEREDELFELQQKAFERNIKPNIVMKMISDVWQVPCIESMDFVQFMKHAKEVYDQKWDLLLQQKQGQIVQLQKDIEINDEINKQRILKLTQEHGQGLEKERRKVEEQWKEKYTSMKNEFSKVTIQYQDSLRVLKEEGALLQERIAQGTVKELQEQLKQVEQEKQKKLDSMKKQYIDTLIQLKEDVKTMRQRHQDKLKQEVEKRKSLDVQWRDKFGKMVNHYQEKLKYGQ